MTNRHAAHQANIDRKANRALTAIESLITQHTGGPDFPDIEDNHTGLVFFLDHLTCAPAEETAPYWVMIGIETDRLAGITHYHPGQRPTNFATSRPAIIEILKELVAAGDPADHAEVVDIFAGLTYSTEDAF